MKIQFDQNNIKVLKHILRETENIVIVPHVNPDGDAIGSSLAFWHILRNYGKNPTVIIPNSFPDFLEWLEGSNSVIDYAKDTQTARKVITKADTIFCLDFNDLKRSEGLKDTLESFSGNKILIDHHPNPKSKYDLMFSHPEISSTCELLYRLMEAIDFEEYINQDAASAIFTGMMTDTGNFSYNASDPETYKIVAKLLEKGVDKDFIHSSVFHTFSADRWRLIGFALQQKMKIIPELKTGYITLSKTELEEFNFQPGDTEGLVNYPLNIKGIRFAVLLIEKDDLVKMSFRSKGVFNTNLFAGKYFSGGGHINASGGKSNESLEDTEATFLNALQNHSDELAALD